MEKNLVLGIDTSNYTTSVCIVDNTGKILFNKQKLLDVRKGERGLRQSEAHFQHIQNLPEFLSEALNSEFKPYIAAVSVSKTPRPVKGSYMPVFTAGQGYAKTIAAALGVPLFEFSHQEGHIEAIKFYSKYKDVNPIICYHFSGGTTEAILYDAEKNIFEIVGGTKDISYGQVLDRVGVSLGLEFPCGAALDRMALSASGHANILSEIKVKDGYVNLSGIESEAQRVIERGVDNVLLADNLFQRISQSIIKMTIQLSSKYDIKYFICAGGVSSSEFVREYFVDNMYRDLDIVFGDPKNSADNAIGIALLGGKQIWD